jgi:predicted RNA methylase
MAESLPSRLADAAFTPSIKQIDAILEQFADETVAKHAERAVLRIETQYAREVAKRSVSAARAAVRPMRARLTRLVARLARDRDPDRIARAWLFEALADADPKTRRVAARGLGQLAPADDIRAALEDAHGRANEEDRAVIALALAKVGGRPLGGSSRASIIAEREALRGTSGGIAPEGSFDRPRPIRFHVRSGLEPVLIDELGRDFGPPRLVHPGVVEATLEGPLSGALAIRTALHVGFPLAPVSGPLAETVAGALAGREAREIFEALTEGCRVRFRIGFASGHRRAAVWEIAEKVREIAPDLVNDPKASPWEARVREIGSQIAIELIPRGYPDARFDYRVAEVPASSHPTIAAALARTLPRRSDDVVWDPFVGAGLELVERARLGPYRRLIGSDVDPRAIEAARANLDRAGVQATLEVADATTFRPYGVSAIVSNPPMGRRVERGSHGDLLERFLTHAGQLLPKGGALVWMDPSPKRTHPRAQAARLRLDERIAVDMGGFSAELSRWTKT